jgi:transcriptional regulator with XRE-family HTH domain
MSSSAAERGERLRSLRETVGLTQEALAERASMTRVEIVKIENGHRGVTSYVAHEAIASAFGLPITDLAALLNGEITTRAAVLRIRATEKRTGTGG